MHSAVVVAAKFCELSEEESTNSGKSSNLIAQKLLKLVYIAHGYKLAIMNQPLISATVEAWHAGPIIPELYRRIKKECAQGDIISSKFSELTDDDLRSISCSDLDVITKTFNTYNKYSSIELSRITRDPSSPWYKIHRNPEEFTNVIISDEDTKRFFGDLVGRLH